MSSSNLAQAFMVGSNLAREEFVKTAFLGSILSGGKFLLGMGNLGAKGSGLARISAHHVGMPLGFGALGALSADEGHKTEGFIKGLAGGLAFNAGMHYGGILGKKVFAPGFRGANYSKYTKGMGFSDEASEVMAASSRLNKPLHAVSRRLSAGTAGDSHINKLRQAFGDSTSRLDFSNNPVLAEKAKKLEELFSQGALGPAQQAELQGLYTDFAKQLYQSGYATGTAGQRAALKGLRFSKGLGTVAGGMGAGMALSHSAESMFDTQPASPFDARGGH
jgi:hypothetical protein